MILLQFDVYSFLLFLLLFWFCFWGIAKLLKLEKRGWEVGPGFFLAKTTRLNRFINKLANRFPRFWRVIWTLGIGFGFGMMIFGMVWLSINLYALITAPSPENALVPVIPGVTVSGTVLLYMIIPIAVIMLSHELAHGIAARIEKIKVKSSGILAFIVLFGAFVEPDEEQMPKIKRVSRQRIYAAGSFSNLVIAFFALILLVNMYHIGNEAHLAYVRDDGPSYGSLQPNELVLAINGTPVIYSNLSLALDSYGPFEPVLFTTQAANGTIFNRTTVPGFDRSQINDTPWIGLTVYSGLNISGNLSALRIPDQKLLILNSSNNLLNFTLTLNLSMTTIDLDNLTALAVDLGLNASENMLDVAKIFLLNSSNPLQNYELFSLQNLSHGIETTSGLSKAAGYDLKDFFNATNCLNLNFVFNHTSNFTLWLDLCRIYLIQNNTESYYGIGFGPYITDRALATIFGPLAPHVYQTLYYIVMFSFAVAIINLLPVPPFDGDKLFTALFDRDVSQNSAKEQQTEGDSTEEKPPKPKEPWTWTKTLIWGVRIFALSIFLGNIILSIINFNILTILSNFL
jgi:membrane-associated protease RseP (regulator of RpoE activity)